MKKLILEIFSGVFKSLPKTVFWGVFYKYGGHYWIPYMFESFIHTFSALLAALPFSSPTWFVIFVLVFITWLVAQASKDPSNRVRWEDMIIDTTSGKTSPYKLGYLVGMIVSTWTITTLVDKSAITFDMFGMYLTYLLGGASWNAFINKKTTNTPTSASEEGVDSTPSK